MGPEIKNRLGTFFLFIDEAGDLGVSPKSSRYIVFAGVRITLQESNRFIKKSRKSFKWRSKKREIRFSKLSNFNKNLFFKKLDALNFCAICCYAPKSVLKCFSKVSDSERREFILEQLISDAVQYLDKFNRIEIDSGLYKKEIRKNLEESLKSKYAIKSVEHKTSNSSAGLQIADMFAGAFRQSLLGNDIYINKIRPLHIISLENLKVDLGENKKIIIKSGNKIIKYKKE